MSATESTTVAPELTALVHDLLVREGELLDDRRFQDWLDLYTEDCLYQVPQGDDLDALHRVQIVHDDKRRLGERVLRLESGFAYSQDPPSRTVHLVGSVRIVGEVEDDVEVRSSLLVAEVRRGTQTTYVARVTHRLARTPDGLRIRAKVIRLANSDVPLGNVTFLI